MSRWLDLFTNHPFQEIWAQIIEVTGQIVVDDTTIVTNVQEIARLKKVTVFINELLDACDPELIPSSTWDNFNTQASTCLQQVNNYQKNRDIGHVKNANNYLDNLLSYIRPYQVVSGKAAKSVSASFSVYSKTINQSMISFQEKANIILKEINDLKEDASSYVDVAEIAKNRIQNLEISYFDNSENESLSSRISGFESILKDSYQKIQNYREILLENDDSTMSEVESLVEKIESDSNSISELLNEIKSKTLDFKKYHTDVFGIKNEEGDFEGGLKAEIIARQHHLDQFKKHQENKYKLLNDEIESLLPGATSAGLASAYHDLKTSFNIPIKNHTRIFYCSICFLVMVAFISVTQELGWFYVKFVDVMDLYKLLSNLLYKLPIVLPILWLTLFASKRRSEALRLQQEYAHKEALAKSYQSFKTQIESLELSDPELMKRLLISAIDAVSKNASDTLDKKHGDKTPVHEGLDGLISSMEKIKKILT